MPSSLTSIWDSYSSCSERIVSPPLPMSRPIFSGSIWIELIRGACSESCSRGASIASCHLAEDELAALLGLVQGVAHDLERDARDLDVHLQGGDALRGARDLEVHVAEVVLDARDVGEDRRSRRPP